MSRVSHFLPFSLVLPNMPGVAIQLVRSVNDDSMSLNDLAELIGKDPALSTTVLRIANTARYSPLRSISSLREATATLGMVTLRNLALSSCMVKSFPLVEGLDRRRFWCRGIATAYYAGLVAQAALVDAEVAYLGGLLLQTGQLLMMQTDKRGVAQVESQVKAPGDRFLLEQSLLGCTHAEVTAELTRRWKFPETLTAGFEAVSKPLDSQPFSALGAVLHIAALLADAMDLASSGTDALNTTALGVVTRLHLNVAWLEDKLITADDLASEVNSMMG